LHEIKNNNMRNTQIHKYILVGLVGLILSYLGGCQSDCCDICDDPCSPFNMQGDTLWIADFERGSDPTEHCGFLGIWKDSLSHIQVFSLYDSIGGGALGSTYYGKVVIAGNDGRSHAGWTGGGLTLTFHADTNGLDLSDYTYLQFEAKVLPGSKFEQLWAKLEDTRNSRIVNTVELLIPTLTHEWQTITILLADFCTSKPPLVPLIKEEVMRLVIVSRHRGNSPFNFDGTICIDNVRFLK